MRYAKYKLIVDEQENVAVGPSSEEIKVVAFAVDNAGWHFCWTADDKDFNDFSAYNMSEVSQDEAFALYSQHTISPVILEDGSFGRSMEEDFINPQENTDPLSLL